MNYAFTDAELTEIRELRQISPRDFLVVDRTGNTPAFVPEHILNLWSTKEFHNGVGVGLGARYVSSRFIDVDNSYKMDHYLTVDGVLFYRYRRWKWTLNFKNITDQEYETRGFGPVSVLPADPFAVYGKIEFSP
ncbi:MAG: TonB-dependent receptor domain-containing protein [bacterium]